MRQRSESLPHAREKMPGLAGLRGVGWGWPDSHRRLTWRGPIQRLISYAEAGTSAGT